MNIESVVMFQLEKTVKMARNYSQREFDRLAIDMTVEQWVLLKIIHEKGPILQKDLAEMAIRDPASVTRTLDLLQKKDLIERHPSDTDRRSHHITLSENGQKRIKNLMPIITKHREKSIDGLLEGDIEQLMTLLRNIQNNMK